MANDDKHPIRSKVIAGVLSGLILAALFYAVPKSLQWIVSALSWFWGYLMSGVSIPHWLLWFLIIVSTVTVIRWIRSLSKRDDEINELTVRMYTQDSFEGVTWRWSYGYYGSPINISPYCPACDSQLVYVRNNEFSFRPSSSVSFYCENCKMERTRIEGGDHRYAISMIERLIDRKIRNGEWKRLIESHGLIARSN